MDLPYSLNAKTRAKFLDTYTVDCVSHTLLMPGESQPCSCGKTIKSDFFLFSFTKDNTNFGMFTAGPSCGREIIKLAKLSTPHMFNPFRTDVSSNHSHVTTGEIQTENALELTPINKEIYNLLNLYRCMTRKDLEGSLLNVFRFITKNPHGDVFDNYFECINESVNTAVEKTQNETLQKYFENLATDNGKKFKTFEFPLFKTKLDLIHESSK